jgi:hypothetical protein
MSALINIIKQKCSNKNQVKDRRKNLYSHKFILQ